MTPPATTTAWAIKAPEPDEYLLITRKEFEQISHSYAVDISQSLPARKRCDLLDTIRSRPHPVTTYPDRHEAYLEGLRDARLNADEAARKAREGVLKELLTIPIDDCDVGGACALIQKILAIQHQAGDPR